MHTFYEVLGVSPDADQDTISEAFRNLAKVYHPDAAGGNAEYFKIINQAYSVLKDPYKRGAYDYQLMLRSEIEEEEQRTEELYPTQDSSWQNFKRIALCILSICAGIFLFAVGDTSNKEEYNGYAVAAGWIFILIGLGFYWNRDVRHLTVKSYFINIGIVILGIFTGYLRFLAILALPVIILAVVFWFNDTFLHIPMKDSPPIKPQYRNGKVVPFLENEN